VSDPAPNHASEGDEPRPTSPDGAERRPNLAWDWSNAALGAAYALPAAALIVDDLAKGLALAVGVLPPALVGLAPKRRERIAVVALGALTGTSIFIGGVLAGVQVLAVAAIAAFGIGAAMLAARWRLGMVAMLFSLPMVGIGLSYPVGKAAVVAGLMVLGGILACLISMLWPERDSAPHAGVESPQPSPPPTLGYGLRLGAAGASAAAIGFLFHLDHVGWACAAALLVMRPAAEMQRLRSVGRVLSVAVGALAAIALLHLSPSPIWYSLAAIAALGGAAGTHGSRWYLTPAFTTFLVFILLLYSDPKDTGWRFGERLLETVLGVGLAYLFGLALPSLIAWGESSSRRLAE
jgi:hypothetical protein